MTVKDNVVAVSKDTLDLAASIRMIPPTTSSSSQRHKGDAMTHRARRQTPPPKLPPFAITRTGS
jgi:hypothetical protein